MIQVQFKNLEASELAKAAVYERVGNIVMKFPDLKLAKIRVTLEMENSPHKPGPDLFTVKLHVPNGRYRGVTVSKSDPNLFAALADVMEHMLEKLNRFGDRDRVKKRAKERGWAKRQMRPQFLEGAGDEQRSV